MSNVYLLHWSTLAVWRVTVNLAQRVRVTLPLNVKYVGVDEASGIYHHNRITLARRLASKRAR